MKTWTKIAIGAAGGAIFLLVVLLSASFPTVEYYEMGFPISQTTGNVRTDKVYLAGKHFLGPDISFKTFLKTFHFVKYDRISVFTSDKLEIDLHTAFQYSLRPHQLVALHEKFDRQYEGIMKSNALDALKNTAIYYSTREFIRERVKVENALLAAVRNRLSGKCCEQGCVQSNPGKNHSLTESSCQPNCKPYTDCTVEDWGLFSRVRLFQLTQVAIPEELSSRFTNALLLIEENEEAKLRQESAIYRKDSIKQELIINNQADLIMQSATANATLIKKLATAEARLLVENARIEGLKLIHVDLNITSDHHKAAFDYLRTLKLKEQTRLAIDFQSYIAGDLGKQ